MSLWHKKATPEDFKPQQKAQRPNVTPVPSVPGRLVMAFLERVSGTWKQVTAVFDFGQEGVIDLHCGICGAEFTGRWNSEGAPIYSGGLLETKKWDKRLSRYARVAQRCRCMAGQRIADMVADADDWTMHAVKRRHRWLRVASRRMLTERGREIVVQGWEGARLNAWGKRSSELMATGMIRAEAQRQAFIEIGDAYDPQPRRPASVRDGRAA